MPTVLRLGPYRFFFYSTDRMEPPHIHVERDHDTAKVWLAPIRLSDDGGFTQNEILRIVHIIRQNEQTLLRRWHEYFKN